MLEQTEKIEFGLNIVFSRSVIQVVCLNGLYGSFGILFLLLVDTEVSSDKIQILQKEVLHLIIFVLLQLNPRCCFEVMRILCQ